MSDELLKHCQNLRSEVFSQGFLPEWIEVQGPVLKLRLPFAATAAANELIAQDPLLKHYRADVTVDVQRQGIKDKASGKHSGFIPVKNIGAGGSESQLKSAAQSGRGPKTVIAVASGKGGVGKSAVSVNLALGLQQAGASVGVLDADIYGPSLPIMMGNQQEKLTFTSDRKMQPLKKFGLELNSLGYLVADDDAAVWRGPMASRALEQLFNDTLWSDLDYLIIDMPPGTGDIQLTLAQKLPVTCAVVVTTPQHIALADAQKGIAMFNKVDVPVVGLLENMSHFECSNCGHTDRVFGAEGCESLAARYKVPVIGQWPLATRLRESMDAGSPLVEAQPDDALSQQIRHSAQLLAANAWELVADH